MGWDKGRYYTRSKKINGRVVREYVGVGQVGELVAQMDAIERQEREAERDTIRAEKAGLEALDAQLNELDDQADLLSRAALVVAGFRQHKRGEWRKRRGNCKWAEQDQSRRLEGPAAASGTRPTRR
jgi:hypothetical protein